MHSRMPNEIYAYESLQGGYRNVAGMWADQHDPGISAAQHRYIRADIAEQRVRKARAETLREAESVARRIGIDRPAFAVDVAVKLRRMAEEAER